MQRTGDRAGITFAVDDVRPQKMRLNECKAFEAVKRTVGGDIESCSDYHGSVITGVEYQPLLAAVYTAYSKHRPVVLSPDAVWITIAQGVAHHMAVEGEKLRSRFVSHEGKLNLVFEVAGWVRGSPENPWPEAFTSWTEQIREHVGPEIYDMFVCDFSTTGPVERAVSQIVMMDVFERYFSYEARFICGIPTVTLEGTPSDWDRIAEKAAGLTVFGLDWWVEHLVPICKQFACAARGDVDLKHWQAICKLSKAYGGYEINGWIAKMFPYIRAYTKGPCTQRNTVFETGEGFSTLDAPSGLSCVPFRCLDSLGERQMEAIGGLVGVTQAPETLALRPKAGWAIRECNRTAVLAERVAAEHKVFPGSRAELITRNYLPSDLDHFYFETDGAELFGEGDGAAYRFVPRNEFKAFGYKKDAENNDIFFGLSSRPWHRFVWLADGTWLAINLAPDYYDPRAQSNHRAGVSFNPICHGREGTENSPEKNPVIALSFTELLERILDGDGRPYWLEPGFVPYGHAGEFVRGENSRSRKPRMFEEEGDSQ